MIINFSNIGSGSGGGTTGSVDTNAIQRYLTAATDSAFTGLTGMKEGDVANIVSYDKVIPNSYEYHDEGWNISYFDNEWWIDREGFDVSLAFDTAQITEQDVLSVIEQHNIEYESDDKLEIVIEVSDSDGNASVMGIAIDSAGTKYEYSQDEWDWVESTSTTPTVSVHVPTNFDGAYVQTNYGDFNLDNPDALYIFREIGSNIKYYYQNGEWVQLSKYATITYVDNKVGSVQGDISVANQRIDTVSARTLNNTTSINTLSGNSQTRYGVVSTLPTGGSEGDVALLQTADTSTTITTAITWDEYAGIVTEHTMKSGEVFTFSADTGASQSRMEVGFWYRKEVAGDNYFCQIGCDNTGQWYYIWDSTSQIKTPWDGSPISFTMPTPFYYHSRYMLNGSDNGAIYIEYTKYPMVNIPYSVIGGQWTRIYRNVMISQSDYDALSGNTDANTIYNITGTTS